MSHNDTERLAPELNISSEELEASFTNHCNDPAAVMAANFDILKNWLKKQSNRRKAYILMGEALIRAGLKLIAREVLDYPPSFKVYLRALTDDMLERLSQVLTKTDMKRLAPKLDISLEEVNRSYAEECDDNAVRSANYKILSRWLKKQNSREQAYIKLGEALLHPDVGLNLIAREVLDYFPQKQHDENQQRSGVK